MNINNFKNMYFSDDTKTTCIAKLKTYTHSQLVDRLCNQYWIATQVLSSARFDSAKHWYKELNNTVIQTSERTGLSSLLLSGIFAILSPMKVWNCNYAEAMTSIQCFKENIPVTRDTIRFFNPKGELKRYYSNNLQYSKINYLLNNPNIEDDILYSLMSFKTNYFTKNISDRLQYVTIDRWNIRHSLGLAKNWDKGVFSDIKNYSKLANAFIEASEFIGIQPAELQAILWVTCRILADKDDIDFKGIPVISYKNEIKQVKICY